MPEHVVVMNKFICDFNYESGVGNKILKPHSPWINNKFYVSSSLD